MSFIIDLLLMDISDNNLLRDNNNYREKGWPGEKKVYGFECLLNQQAFRIMKEFVRIIMVIIIVKIKKISVNLIREPALVHSSNNFTSQTLFDIVRKVI